MSLQKMKYTNSVTEVLTYNTGITSYANIYDIYHDTFLRDKVVCRINIMYVFTRFMSEKSVEICEDALLKIAMGLITDPTLFSNLMLTLAKEDKLFSDTLNKIYSTCPEECPIGIHIINTFANEMLDEVDRYRRFFRGAKEMVVCLSDKYIYFSVTDTDYIPEIPEDVDVEVVSNAKNWNCNFRVGRSIHSAISV